MFHLKYPKSQSWFTWDELGCICRALGFPTDIFSRNLPPTGSGSYEIHWNDKGIPVKSIREMLDEKLLFKALHHTFNMHSAVWNACVISKALQMLTHKVLSFEELHTARVAYSIYEHIDMKGMVLNKNVLIRTLKMCGRTIAPLKLVHRVKHMKPGLEEKGRLQLYEFFNLLVWCDVSIAYCPEETQPTLEKYDKLFSLQSFEETLSHYDKRLHEKLDTEYLEEERNFCKEKLQLKCSMSGPLIYSDTRIFRAQQDSKNYRHLKQEVSLSQRRVYRASAGSIRQRPISAPDLDQYRPKEKHIDNRAVTAQAAYFSLQQRFCPSKISYHSSTKRMRTKTTRPDTPRTVTEKDLADARLKMANLEFDIKTLTTRVELQNEEERKFYIPSFTNSIKKKQDAEPSFSFKTFSPLGSMSSKARKHPENDLKKLSKSSLADRKYVAPNSKDIHCKSLHNVAECEWEANSNENVTSNLYQDLQDGKVNSESFEVKKDESLENRDESVPNDESTDEKNANQSCVLLSMENMRTSMEQEHSGHIEIENYGNYNVNLCGSKKESLSNHSLDPVLSTKDGNKIFKHNEDLVGHRLNYQRKFTRKEREKFLSRHTGLASPTFKNFLMSNSFISP